MAEAWLKPYPYDEYKKFPIKRTTTRQTAKIADILIVVASIFSPLTIITFVWSNVAFRYYNESPKKRGYILAAIGLVWLAITWPHQHEIWTRLGAIFASLTQHTNVAPQDAFLSYSALSIPWSLIVGGLCCNAQAMFVEVHSERWLKQQHPTPLMHLKKKYNEQRLKTGKTTRKEKGRILFGIETKNRFPWRTSLYGRVISAPVDKLRHGVVVGGSGRGKTQFISGITRQLLINDCAVIYVDFKDSPDAKQKMKNSARIANRPFYSLDYGTNETTWADLFNWKGTPAEKASIIISCMQMDEGGGAGFYAAVAESWAPLQLEVLEIVGLREWEGVFDFLLETATTGGLTNRINDYRNSKDPKAQAVYKKVLSKKKNVKDDQLTSYRNELEKIVNSAGHRLRPNPEHPEPLSIRKVMQDGGLFHIGIASDIDQVTLKVVGSLLMKQIQILVKERQDTGDYRNDWLLTYLIVDEASQLEDRISLYADLYDKSREAGVFIWSVTQHLDKWPDDVVSSVQSDSTTFVALKQGDPKTSQALADTLGAVFARQTSSESQSRLSALGQSRRDVEDTEERITITSTSHLYANEHFKSVEQFHAWMWFTDETMKMSTERWLYRNRVRGDMNAEHAAHIKLVMYKGTDLPSDESAEVEPIDYGYDQPEMFRLGGGEVSPDLLPGKVSEPEPFVSSVPVKTNSTKRPEVRTAESEEFVVDETPIDGEQSQTAATPSRASAQSHVTDDPAVKAEEAPVSLDDFFDAPETGSVMAEGVENSDTVNRKNETGVPTADGGEASQKSRRGPMFF